MRKIIALKNKNINIKKKKIDFNKISSKILNRISVEINLQRLNRKLYQISSLSYTLKFNTNFLYYFPILKLWQRIKNSMTDKNIAPVRGKSMQNGIISVKGKILITKITFFCLNTILKQLSTAKRRLNFCKNSTWLCSAIIFYKIYLNWSLIIHLIHTK